MENIDIGIIRFAELKDLPYIIDLSKKENYSIGFIPKMAYESAITGIKKGDRWSDTCNDRLWVCEINKDLVGFVLASFGRVNAIWKQGKIAQICLQTDARMMQRGKFLLDSVINYGKTINTLSFNCGCADDLPSNLFWQTMGWIKINQRNGISHKNTWKQTSKRKVNLYRYDPFDIFIQSEINIIKNFSSCDK